MNDGTEKRPDVSVIIPVRDGGRLLQDCLAAIRDQETGPYTVEVVVVDNGSLEDTRRLVEPFPGTLLLHESLPSSYAARNFGIRRSSGPVLAFTDADTLPRPDWLRQGLDTLKDAQADEGQDDSEGPLIVAGRVEIVLPPEPNLYEIYDKLHNLLQERYVTEGGYGVTANLFIPRTLFDHAGLFREDWVSGADAEFCRRAVNRGARITYQSDAVVEHPPRATFADFRAKKIRVGRGLTRMARAGGEGGRGRAFMAALLAAPACLWPGLHLFRSRFRQGMPLGLSRQVQLQLLHWLGKFYLLKGRLEEA